MFNEHELLILSFCVDKISEEDQDRFFSKEEGRLVCHKIHNMLRALRLKNTQLAMRENGI